MDFTGTGNSLNPVHPSVLRLIMDSLRYWVIECHVDGFRFDLASALARELYDVDRLSAFFDVIHQDPVLSQVKLIAEPWDSARAATRSATSRCSGPSGTASTATRCATSGAARRAWPTFALALHRLERSLRGGRPPPVGVDQLRHRARRLHARRPRLVQRQAQRGEPRGQRATAPTTTARGTAASRGRPTTPRSTRCASASSATSWRRCCSRRACRCCSAATSWAARSAATTTPGARTTRSPGSTGSSTTARGAARVHAPPARAAARAPGLPPHAASSTAAARRRGLPDAWWFRPDGRRMTAADWQNHERTRARRLPQRPRNRGGRPAGRADRRLLVPAAAQRPPRGRRVHAAAAPLRAALAGRALDRLPARDRRRVLTARGSAHVDGALAAPAAPARRAGGRVSTPAGP